MQIRFMIFIVWLISLLTIIVFLFYPVLFISPRYIESDEWSCSLTNLSALVLPQITIVVTFIYSRHYSNLKRTFNKVDDTSKFAVLSIVVYNVILILLSAILLRISESNTFVDGTKIIILILGVLAFIPTAAMSHLFKTEEK